jgi:hypothetical protein
MIEKWYTDFVFYRISIIAVIRNDIKKNNYVYLQCY